MIPNSEPEFTVPGEYNHAENIGGGLVKPGTPPGKENGESAAEAVEKVTGQPRGAQFSAQARIDAFLEQFGGAATNVTGTSSVQVDMGKNPMKTEAAMRARREAANNNQKPGSMAA